MTESFRPRYHFTPPANWMNDPNGLFYYDGRYHLYYQHNPSGTAWGHMSWGHAVSADLVHWQHLPVAIPERPEEGYTIFSGSAVVDSENTSGFATDTAPAVVAVFTADYRALDPRVQRIHVAYSTDSGRTFTEYGGNPVIDIGEAKFGDPKVFWHAPTQRWVLIAIEGLGQGHAVLYGSPDLRTWRRLDEFHAPEAAPGVWECPDLFPLAVDGEPAKTRWVLKVNCVAFGEGRSGTRYFCGDFDGRAFTGARLVGESLTSDQGAVYAEVTYNHAPRDRRVLVGWLRQQPEEGRSWTGAQSVPRELSLCSTESGLLLRQRPIPELEALRGQRWVIRDRPLTEPLTFTQADLASRSLDVRLVLDLRHATSGGLRLRLSEGSVVSIGVDVAAHELFVAREDSGDRVGRGDYLRDCVGGGRPRAATSSRVQTCRAQAVAASGAVELRVLLDQDIVEAFAGNEAAVTTYLPFSSTYDSLGAYGTGAAPHLVRADVWSMAAA